MATFSPRMTDWLTAAGEIHNFNDPKTASGPHHQKVSYLERSCVQCHDAMRRVHRFLITSARSVGIINMRILRYGNIEFLFFMEFDSGH
jgi:hypothetical protein